MIPAPPRPSPDARALGGRQIQTVAGLRGELRQSRQPTAFAATNSIRVDISTAAQRYNVALD
jgi:hypothetical protein